MLFALPIILVPLAQGKPLVASSIFTALSLVDNLTANILNLTFGLNSAADFYAVVKRMEQVLLLEEKEERPLEESELKPLSRLVTTVLTTSWRKPGGEIGIKKGLLD